MNKNIDEIKNMIKSEEYRSLFNNPLVKDNIILIGLGGSYAYGTANDDSDVDIRGIATNSREAILTHNCFDQVVDNKTDTVIYSFDKIVKLLSGNNPNVIEILGLEPWQYLYINDIGQALIDNANMFLSKRVVKTFGAYANSQLRRLDNKAVRLVEQERRENHILNSINNARYTFPDKYFYYPEDSIKLYIDKAVQEDYDTEIFMDVNLHHYPLRDYKAMWSEMHNIVKDYSKIGKRNNHAIEHNKLGKHMMHLVRLFYMCFDILEKHEIITYRTREHDLLMDIRDGKYLDSNRQPIPEFFEMVDELEKRLDYDKKNTDLPEVPDYKMINEFVMAVNESVIIHERVV